MKSICKSLRVKERQLRNKRRKLRKPVWYCVAPEDPSTLILRNGRRLKKKPDMDLFISSIGEVYSLTSFGLRHLRINYTRKKWYGHKTRNGVNNGRRYPYVTFRGKTRAIHIIMADAWMRPRRDYEEVDHLDGNIDNFRLSNLEIVTKQENQRRGKILRAMRKAALDANDSSLDPINRTPEEMKAIYRDFRF